MAEEIKSRVDLYSAVWSKPMMKLAEEFGISGRGLAKLCERLKVPVPPRGYWRKVSLGQSIKKIPLPEGKRAINPNLKPTTPSID